MADWRQIQARIRKAKAGTDAPAKLAELYEQTRDAMVAFELARWQEKAGEHAEAARWYTAAAERFRRSQWKTKAEAALARLRNPASAGAEPTGASEAPGRISDTTDSEPVVASSGEPSISRQIARKPADWSAGHDADETAGDGVGASEISDEPSQHAQAGDLASEEMTHSEQPKVAPGQKRPRRRGRRGGRNRRRPERLTTPKIGQPSSAQAQHITPVEKPAAEVSLSPEPVLESNAPVSIPTSADAPAATAWRGRNRAGEPALASRTAHLESQLRRLLACPQAKLEQAETAPAGPGVLLLSDSDQVSHYYVESCQTLRIAIGNLVRGGRGAKDPPRLKESLAENLGIAESRVTNYLKEHCTVRWIQLDEGASELAHFAIALLRPVVNE